MKHLNDQTTKRNIKHKLKDLKLGSLVKKWLHTEVMVPILQTAHQTQNLKTILPKENPQKPTGIRPIVSRCDSITEKYPNLWTNGYNHT